MLITTSPDGILISDKHDRQTSQSRLATVSDSLAVASGSIHILQEYSPMTQPYYPQLSWSKLDRCSGVRAGRSELSEVHKRALHMSANTQATRLERNHHRLHDREPSSSVSTCRQFLWQSATTHPLSDDMTLIATLPRKLDAVKVAARRQSLNFPTPGQL